MMETGGTEQGSMRLILGMALVGTVGVGVLKSGLDPVTLVFWRSVIGTACLLPWCFYRGILPDRRLGRRNILISLLAGASLVVSWGAFFEGMILTSITTATVIMHLQPFFIVLLGAVLWKERLHGYQLVCLLLAFIGVVLASGLLASPEEVHGRWIMGACVTLAGAFIYAVTAMAGKALRGQRGEVTTLFQTVMGVLVFLPFVNFHQSISLPAWEWLVAIGVVPTALAWVLVYSALPKLPTALVAILSFVNPLTAIMLDWLIFHHPLTFIQFVGLVLIIASTVALRLGVRLPGSLRLR